MKKLLIATMAAVSVGLYAKAADAGFISGTSFEGDEFNQVDSVRSLKVNDGLYWVTDAKDGLFVATNVADYVENDMRPIQWKDSSNATALSIDTDKPLVRLIDDDGVVQNVSPDPIFFDSVVQFTATDVKPIEDGQSGNGTDKLMVWLYQSPEDVTAEKPGTFNEIARTAKVAITAGYLDSETLKVVNYLTNIEDVEVAPDSWHRLTIKSFMDGGFLKFNVWIDGVPVKTVNGESSFLSMLDKNTSSTPTQLQGVAFDGKGAVDDIVFTTTNPFAEPSYEVTVKLSDIDDVTGGYYKAYSLNGGNDFITLDESVTGEEGVKLTIPTSVQSILFKLSIVEGYKIDGVETSTGEQTDDGYYWTKTVAMADINIENGKGEISLAIVEGGAPTVNPTSGTLSAVVAGAAEADPDAIAAQVTISISEADTTAGVKAAYFKKTAVYDQANSQWVVTVALDETVVQPSADEALEDVAAALTDDETTVSITYNGDDIKPGLYYGLAVAGDLTALETAVPANFERATASGVLLSADKPEGNAGFFKVVISATNPNPVQE